MLEETDKKPETIVNNENVSAINNSNPVTGSGLEELSDIRPTVLYTAVTLIAIIIVTGCAGLDADTLHLDPPLQGVKHDEEEDEAPGAALDAAIYNTATDDMSQPDIEPDNVAPEQTGLSDVSPDDAEPDSASPDDVIASDDVAPDNGPNDISSDDGTTDDTSPDADIAPDDMSPPDVAQDDVAQDDVTLNDMSKDDNMVPAKGPNDIIPEDEAPRDVEIVLNDSGNMQDIHELTPLGDQEIKLFWGRRRRSSRQRSIRRRSSRRRRRSSRSITRHRRHSPSRRSSRRSTRRRYSRRSPSRRSSRRSSSRRYSRRSPSRRSSRRSTRRRYSRRSPSRRSSRRSTRRRYSRRSPSRRSSRRSTRRRYSRRSTRRRYSRRSPSRRSSRRSTRRRYSRRSPSRRSSRRSTRRRYSRRSPSRRSSRRSTRRQFGPECSLFESEWSCCLHVLGGSVRACAIISYDAFNQEFYLQIEGMGITVFEMPVQCNLLVIIAVRITRKLQTVSNLFVVNLSICDLLFVCLVLPFSVYSYIEDGWDIDHSLCKFIGYLGYSLTGTTIITITLIAYNRYKMVLDLPGYKTTFTGRNVRIMVSLAWLIPAFLLIPPLLEIWGKFGYEPMLVSCNLLLDHPSQLFKLFLLVVRVGFPFCFILYFYGKIYHTMRKSHQRIHKTVSSLSALEINNQKKEMHLTKMMVAIFVVFIVSYLPCTITGMIDWNNVLSKQFHMFCAITVYIGCAANPVIYGLMNTQFREAYFRIVCCGMTYYRKLRTNKLIHVNSVHLGRGLPLQEGVKLRSVDSGVGSDSDIREPILGGSGESLSPASQTVEEESSEKVKWTLD